MARGFFVCRAIIRGGVAIEPLVWVTLLVSCLVKEGDPMEELIYLIAGLANIVSVSTLINMGSIMS